MIIPDVNLLLYAMVSGFPQHQQARAWWEETLNGPDAVGLAAPALFGFLRLITNPRIVDPPLAISLAAQHVRGWVNRPNVEVLAPGIRYLDLALDLLEEVGTAANLTTDAQLAAHALQQDAQLCSNDTDFGRFPGLRWMNPLAVG
ncbi:MAG: TA system VapC family ribonuclease toxin [Actinomycetota bacterium]